jgi:hypothetical protein
MSEEANIFSGPTPGFFPPICRRRRSATFWRPRNECFDLMKSLASPVYRPLEHHHQTEERRQYSPRRANSELFCVGNISNPDCRRRSDDQLAAIKLSDRGHNQIIWRRVVCVFCCRPSCRRRPVLAEMRLVPRAAAISSSGPALRQCNDAARERSMRRERQRRRRRFPGLHLSVMLVARHHCRPRNATSGALCAPCPL